MEPTTVATIVVSLFMGIAIGFFTMSVGDIRIKLAINAVGAVSLVLFLYAIMPSASWEAPIDVATQQVADFTVTAVYALLSYTISDVFGSLGYALVTGSSG